MKIHYLEQPELHNYSGVTISIRATQLILNSCAKSKCLCLELLSSSNTTIISYDPTGDLIFDLGNHIIWVKSLKVVLERLFNCAFTFTGV